MPAVYRAPMRSRRDDVDPGLAVQRALDAGICGTGGLLSPPPEDLGSALAAMESAYGERPARRLERFAAVPDGSYVWTRDADGLYFLGRIEGPWRYDPSRDAGLADLVHVRACTWLAAPVAESDVPAATLQTFARGGRNFQRTHDEQVGAHSERLWRDRT